MAIAAGTDYAISILGRYQEARNVGLDREAAYYNMFRGTVHVIVGSGLTIAGAVGHAFTSPGCRIFKPWVCLPPSACSRPLTAALTLGPAVLVIASRFGLLAPKRKVALIGLLALPGYKTSYDAGPYLSDSAPAKIGYAVAERHFSQARLNPELLMIESDHDMRNPADMLILERRQERPAHPRHLPGAVDHQAPGHADLAQLHSLSDQRPKRNSARSPQGWTSWTPCNPDCWPRRPSSC